MHRGLLSRFPLLEKFIFHWFHRTNEKVTVKYGNHFTFVFIENSYTWVKFCAESYEYSLQPRLSDLQ